MKKEKLKKLTQEEIEDMFDVLFPALNSVDGEFRHALLNLGAYFSCHITKESAEKIADDLTECFDGLIEESQIIKENLLYNYDVDIKKGSLTRFCWLLAYDDYSIKDSIHERLTNICGPNSEDLAYDMSYDFYSGKYHYTQENKEIYLVEETKDGEKQTLKAIFSVDNLTRYTDALGLSEPLYSLTYYHGYDNELKTIEKATKEQILKILMDEDLFNTDIKEAERIFMAIRHSLHHQRLMGKRQTLLATGFFIDGEGKLISKTKIDDLPSSTDDLRKAMLLIIEVLHSNPSSEHKNANVLRIMLVMPYYYCIKQLGLAEGNTNGLILYGKAGSGKTAICKIGLWYYLEEPYDYNASADTLSSLTRILNSTTLPTICDDSYGLLNQPNVQNTIKKGMYEKFSRTVSDKDSIDVLQYKALSTPIFTYNENIPLLDDGLERRLNKIHYDKSNVISDDESSYFKKKFRPFNKNSPLEKLHHIGIAFRDWIKPKLESNSEELDDMESLSIEFFKETLDKLGLEYAPLTTKYEYETNVEDYGATIRNEFNKKLLRSKLTYTNGVHTANLINVAKSGYFSWLKYQPKNDEFVIGVKDFVSACNKATNHSWSFDDLMSELDIADYHVKQIKAGGKPIPKATFIGKNDLAQKILNINSLIDDDMEDSE